MIFYQSQSQDFTLLQGDSLHILPTIHDKSIKTEYKTYEEKVDFVYKNLTKEN